jgi:DNA-binding NtrC family response regulator
MSSAPPSILVVDDEPAIRLALSGKLGGAGFRVVQADCLASARQRLADADLVLLDYLLPDGSGFELLGLAQSQHAGLPVIMMTGHSSVTHAVDSMKAGAFHYLQKPVDLGLLQSLVMAALESSQPWRELRRWRTASTSGGSLLLGAAPCMEEVRQLLARIASSPASTVLITGESGTGKDLAARVIHVHSERGAGPLLNINCSALPEGLLESELFGHERGAFTDARQRKLGLLEQAGGGTVFLDEIGEMPGPLQAKLLRFLEDKSFRRVGGAVEIRTDVRVIAATHVDLREAVRRGRFREDLYYRLAVLTVQLPPLRKRPGDSILLAEFFRERFAAELQRPARGLGSDAQRLITEYPWPGNVRELRNAMERAVLLSDQAVLGARDFETLTSPTLEEPQFDLPAGGVDLRTLEKSLVEQALARTGGNRTRAAALLGVNRDQIRYRIENYRLASGGHKRS